MKKSFSIGLSALTAAFLIGCGGGSSSSSDDTSSGTASDAYVAHATVIVDTNKDGVFDNKDYQTKTDANGRFTIPSQYRNYAIKVTGGTDTATDKNVSDMQLPANAKKLNVTPVTTFLAGMNGDEAKAAQILGISEDKLYNDPMAQDSNESTLATLKLNFAKNAAKADSYTNIAKHFDTNLTNTIVTLNTDLNKTAIEKALNDIKEANLSSEESKFTLEKSVEALTKVIKDSNKSIPLKTLQEVTSKVEDNITNDAALISLISQVATNHLKNGEELNVTTLEDNVSKYIKVVKKYENNDSIDVSNLVKNIVNKNITDPDDSNLTKIEQDSIKITTADAFLKHLNDKNISVIDINDTSFNNKSVITPDSLFILHNDNTFYDVDTDGDRWSGTWSIEDNKVLKLRYDAGWTNFLAFTEMNNSVYTLVAAGYSRVTNEYYTQDTNTSVIVLNSPKDGKLDNNNEFITDVVNSKLDEINGSELNKTTLMINKYMTAKFNATSETNGTVTVTMVGEGNETAPWIIDRNVTIINPDYNGSRIYLIKVNGKLGWVRVDMNTSSPEYGQPTGAGYPQPK